MSKRPAYKVEGILDRSFITRAFKEDCARLGLKNAATVARV